MLIASRLIPSVSVVRPSFIMASSTGYMSLLVRKNESQFCFDYQFCGGSRRRTASIGRFLSGLSCNTTKDLQAHTDPSLLWRFSQDDLLKPPLSRNADNKLRSTSPVPSGDEQKKPSENGKKLTLWQRTKKELVHYYHGFRLLGLETKIAVGICFRLLRGHSLTRRERKQLVRTVADIIRLVPFAVFIIVPFMEFLLPFYLKFFPFMLPSTFKEKRSETDKIQQRLKAKLEMARFLQETLRQTTNVPKKTDGTPTVSEFQSFLKQVQESGQPASNEEIARFSKFFEDQVTLDSLELKQLKMLCQLLSLPTIGPSNLLRFQIWMRVRQLKAEDRLIAKEGVDQIPSWELQNLCQDRGMRSAGLTEERLRSQLSQWLALHLEKNVPVTLLLFSRALHVTKPSDSDVSLKEAIAQLPPSASEAVTTHVLESSPTSDVDPRTKMEVLRKEQASIRAARAQRIQEQKEEEEKTHGAPKSIPVESQSDVLVDTAPILKDIAVPTHPVSTKIPIVVSDTESRVATAVRDGITPPSKPSDPDLKANVDENVIHAEPSVPSSDSPIEQFSGGREADASKEEVTEISAEDLAQIESAILKSSNALDEEALDDLKEEIAEAVKASQTHEVTADVVVDKKTSKAAARLSARVGRLINEMDVLVDKLKEDRQTLLKNIEIQEVHAKHTTEPAERTEFIKAIEADQQRMIDINDLLQSLRQIQKAPDDSRRWQKILELLDEDNDGKIELQHVLSAIELLGTEKVKLSSKEVKRLFETFDKEQLVEKIASADKPVSTSDANLSKATVDSEHVADNEKDGGPPKPDYSK